MALAEGAVAPMEKPKAAPKQKAQKKPAGAEGA